MEKKTKVIVGLLIFIIVLLGAFCVILISRIGEDTINNSQIQEQLDAANSDLASTKSELNKATSQINKVKEAVSDNTTEEKETTASSTTKNTGYKTPYVDFSNGKCLNAASDNNKYLPARSSSCLRGAIVADLDSTSKKVKVTLNYSIKDIYQTDIGDKSEYEVSNFTKKVANVYIYGMGQASGNEYILYLMEDGTVEYTKVLDSIKNKSFKSAGKVEGISDITEIVSGAAGYIEPGQDGGAGWRTFFGITTTGDYYDLGEMLRDK